MHPITNHVCTFFFSVLINHDQFCADSKITSSLAIREMEILMFYMEEKCQREQQARRPSLVDLQHERFLTCGKVRHYMRFESVGGL